MQQEQPPPAQEPLERVTWSFRFLVVYLLAVAMIGFGGIAWAASAPDTFPSIGGPVACIGGFVVILLASIAEDVSNLVLHQRNLTRLTIAACTHLERLEINQRIIAQEAQLSTALQLRQVRQLEYLTELQHDAFTRRLDPEEIRPDPPPHLAQ